MSETEFQMALAAYARDKGTCFLGESFVDPFAHCLAGFENLDRGVEEECNPSVLLNFRVEVVDPFTSINLFHY